MSDETGKHSAAAALLRLAMVLIMTGQGRSAVYAGIKNGTFPRPVKLGTRSVAWVKSEIDQWIAERVAERDQAGDR